MNNRTHNVSLLAVFLASLALSACTVPTATQDNARSFEQCDAQGGKVADIKLGTTVTTKVTCALPNGAVTVYNSAAGLYYVDVDADGAKAACALRNSNLTGRTEDGKPICTSKQPKIYRNM